MAAKHAVLCSGRNEYGDDEQLVHCVGGANGQALDETVSVSHGTDIIRKQGSILAQRSSISRCRVSVHRVAKWKPSQNP